MKTLKKRTFSGAVCEQEVYNVADRCGNIYAKPRLRFKDEEERAKHRDGISRRNHARLVNKNFNSKSLYITLTLDDEHEVHTFKEAKRIRSLYIRRLKYAFPQAVIFAYLGRGKNTQRIHLHILAHGIPEEEIIRKWGNGDILRIVNLREHNYYDGVDYGEDYTGLANYLFDHWTEEQGGHRWAQTANALRPDTEKPTEAKREYSAEKAPKAPCGYMLVETKTTTYGYMYFKYVKIPPKKSRKRE